MPTRLSHWLPDFNALVPADLSPMGHVSALLLVALLLLVLLGATLFAFYHMVQSAAVEFEVALIGRLRAAGSAAGDDEDPIGTANALTDCLDYHFAACVPRLAVGGESTHAMQFNLFCAHWSLV
ncbi:MAG: hypothetical protein R3C56_17545 [Pirellulaceae bacterium]